ncbi:unnamed protein product [Adineta steineri]|uniref:Uncharacterized protein n=1 Tax=Adineta steineri TaxID=433720 RepID=A0A819YVU0_9BILA|nr:unnamed protein product [Adineta steineri]CAF1109063.1 unnamed protein product [Adineta steineri]CAF1165499.1 unnamed protein product [Adineta steineri]CAF1498546.1 unnamed protein product [Adineta steineri]CAF3997698.1 unnamed protein product [Adineta steineri]
MATFNLPKCMVIMMVLFLVLESHSTVEAVRRDEIKALLRGTKFAQNILRVKTDPLPPCTSCDTCTVDCSTGCKSCTTDAKIF